LSAYRETWGQAHPDTERNRVRGQRQDSQHDLQHDLQHDTHNDLAPLPVSIAFLAEYGIAPADLRRAALAGWQAGTDALPWLFCECVISQRDYYRLLARHLDLPFIAAPQLGEAARFPESLHAGIAPLAVDGQVRLAPRLVMAPGPDQIATMMLRRQTGLSRSSGLALTDPEALRRAVFAYRAEEIARMAADALPRRDAALSIKSGLWPHQRAILLGGTCAIGLFALLVGPLASYLIITAMVSVICLALANLRLLGCLHQAPVHAPLQPRDADASLPVYSVVIALYREAGIVDQLYSAIDALDYPRARLDVIFVLEEGDFETRAVLEPLARARGHRVLFAPEGAPRTKPRALNVALALAQGECLVVYDAEDLPDPGQLRLAANRFARSGPELGCLQARLAIDNDRDGFLAACFAIEYAALFDVVNPGLAANRMPVPLGGTSNHFRVEALRMLSGWDAWNVTEDADLGLRLALQGFDVGDLPVTTWEEAPVTFGNWFGQRKRWMKGFLQTAITHTRNPASALTRVGVIAYTGSLAVTAGAVISAMAYPMVFVVLTVLVFTLGARASGLEPFWLAWLPPLPGPQQPLALVALALASVATVAGTLSMFLPPAVALWRRRWFRLYPVLLLMPFYYLLVSAAAWMGMVELCRNASGWNKTEHGVSRSRRMLPAARCLGAGELAKGRVASQSPSLSDAERASHDNRWRMP
jgi:cellulose synthase/poly-beta-1,6-N-acetylglucosamine synthase-like glycosyltransferase